MKWTLAKIRREAWKLLNLKSTRITLREIPLPGTAMCVYREDGIDIHIDTYETDIVKAVAHELMHVLLDPYFQKFTTYSVHEYFIASLEKPFFRNMPIKEQARWRRAIMRKIPKKYQPPKEK